MSVLITGIHSSHSGEVSEFLDEHDLYLVRQGDQYWHDEDAVHYEVRFWAEAPLVLTTGEQMREWWERAGGCVQATAYVGPGEWERFHPDATRRFTAAVRAAGHDAVVITASAVAQEGSRGEHDPVAYEWGANTFGDPQTIILEASRAEIRRVYKETA